MRASRPALALGLVSAVGVAFWACEGPPAGPDGGRRSGDVGQDTRAPLDTNRDGDLRDSPETDAGPWPPFEPHLVFEDPTVVCSPVTYPFSPPAVPAGVAPGDVLWTYDLAAADPDVWAMLRRNEIPHWDNRITSTPMTVTLDGGVIATQAAASLLRIGGDGRWVGSIQSEPYQITGWGTFDGPATPSWQPTLTPTNNVWLVQPRSVSILEWLFDPIGRGDAGPLVRFDGVASLPPGGIGPSFIQSTGVLTDGTMVWQFSERYIAGSCTDGRTRWVVETSRRLHDIWDGPHFVGLRDGSVLAYTNGTIWHLDADGHYLGLTEFYGDYVEGCGFYRAQISPTGETTVERLAEDMATSLPPIALGAANWAIAPDCDMWVMGIHGTELHASVRLVSPEGVTRWSRDYDFMYVGRLAPLEDGGLMLGPGPAPNSIVVINHDGSIRWQRSYDSDPLLRAALGNEVLRPDGVILVESNEVAAGPFFAAIYTGVTPARTAWFRERTTWARNRAVWMLPPPD